MNIRKITILLALTTVVGLSHTDIAPASIGQIGSFGTTGPGTLKGAEGIAVNANTNNVYVADKLDHRVVEYDQEGNFILTFGREVNQTKTEEKQKGNVSITETEKNICTAASTNTCIDGAEGSAPGQLDWPTGVAVDPTTGDVYVSDGGNERIEKYTPEGEYISQIVSGQNGAPDFTIGAYNEVLANDTIEFGSFGNDSWVDTEGYLYLSTNPKVFEGAVYRFAPDGQYTGDAITEGWVNVDGPGAVVVGPSGQISVSEGGSSEAIVLLDADGRLLSRLQGGTTYCSRLAERAMNSYRRPLAVNLITGELLDVGGGQACEPVAHVLSASGLPVMEFPVQGETFEGANRGIHPYVYQAVAYGTGVGKLYQLTGGGEKVEVAVYGTFPLPTPAAPVVSNEDWSGVELSSVTLNAKIDPRSLGTTYWFEYGTDPGLVGASSAPALPESAGSGFLPVGVSVPLSALQQSTTYYYRAVAHNAFGGAGTTVDGPIQSFTTLAPSPSAVTEGANEVSSNAALVTGTVVPGSSGAASETSWCFQYGPTELTGYTMGFLPATPAGDAGQGTSPVPVTVRLTRLQPGTTYRYRLVAVNSSGSRLSSTACNTEGGHETDGAEGQFTTSPNGSVPIVASGPAKSISQTSAMLTGSVDPEGVRTVYYFQLGASIEYGVGLFAEAGEGVSSEPVSVLVSSLQPGTTYHYRVVATNANGTSYGADESFTTPTFPSSVLVAPVTAPLIGAPNIAFPAGSRANTGTTETKKLTNTQKLAKALRACGKKKSKHRRASCEKAARNAYAPMKKK
jgi:NHL repeat